MIRRRGLAMVVGLVLAIVVVASAAWATRSPAQSATAEGATATGPSSPRPARPPTWGTWPSEGKTAKPDFTSIAFSPDGTLYASDCGEARIYRITPGRPGVTKVVGGRGPGGFFGWERTTKLGWLEKHAIAGDGGPPTNAIFSCPISITFDDAGNMYIADLNNGRIREITTDNVVRTFAGVGPGFPFLGPWSVGIGTPAGDGGQATHAILRNPNGLAFDDDGSMYIADRDHAAIRKVDPNGVITTVAGTGVHGYNGDNQLATLAKLKRPVDVTFDASGNLYISDENNRRIRMVDQNGVITTVAGNGKRACGGDGGPATKASFRNPGVIQFLPDGTLLVSDGECNAIRRIWPGGRITTYAGVGDVPHPCSGIVGLPVRELPIAGDVSFAMTPGGELLISDGGCREILRVNSTGILRRYAHAPGPHATP